jgi:hypothetical protein
MTKPTYKVRRRAFSERSGKLSLSEAVYSVDLSVNLAERIQSDPNLSEVRPREILEITLDEDVISVADAVAALSFVESDVPDDMPVGLHHEVLWELLGDDADKLCFYEDEWSRTTGSIIRRALFVNGRTFIPFRDEWSPEVHFVECESIAAYEAPTPKFLQLAGIGFTEENSMVSGYDGEEVGLISEDVAIWYTRRDEEPNEVRVFRMEPERHANLILELMSSQFRPFMSKIMVEGLVGRIPEAFGEEIPSIWVESDGSWSAITTLHLHPLLTSDSPRSPIRQQILDVLLDSRRGENFEAWLAEYIESVVDSKSLAYEQRLERQAQVESEVAKWDLD